MDETIVKIICDKDKDETNVRVLEVKEGSVIIMMSLYYAHTIEDYETASDGLPEIPANAGYASGYALQAKIKKKINPPRLHRRCFSPL